MIDRKVIKDAVAKIHDELHRDGCKAVRDSLRIHQDGRARPFWRVADSLPPRRGKRMSARQVNRELERRFGGVW